MTLVYFPEITSCCRHCHCFPLCFPPWDLEYTHLRYHHISHLILQDSSESFKKEKEKVNRISPPKIKVINHLCALVTLHNMIEINTSSFEQQFALLLEKS